MKRKDRRVAHAGLSRAAAPIRPIALKWLFLPSVVPSADRALAQAASLTYDATPEAPTRLLILTRRIAT